MKYIFNLLFLAFCRSQFPLLMSLTSKSHYCDANELEKFKKKKINYQNKFQLFSVFLFSLTSVWVFFLFPYQSVSKFWKIDKKILMEIFCQKLIVSNVTSTFLDHPEMPTFKNQMRVKCKLGFAEWVNQLESLGTLKPINCSRGSKPL